jgi:hypothetical protein
MQELALIRPSRTADKELLLELEKTALRREFEECLADCGMLAFRVARGVLRNGADAEDVATDHCPDCANSSFSSSRVTL